MALNYSFSGKRILVTGGGRGIGRQLVQRFHDDGAIVFTIDKEPERIQEIKTALPKVTADVVDLTNWDATRKVVESFGVLDHLVNNAGIGIAEPFLQISKETMAAIQMCRRQFDVNLTAMVNVSQVMAKGLIAAGRSGSIVNIASIAALRANPFIGLGVYSASKAGVENLTKSMAIELGPHNIRVNAISPGLVDTPMHCQDAWDFETYKEAMLKRHIVKRFVDPNEVADLALFLLSALSKMIVGESVVIDAGYMTN